MKMNVHNLSRPQRDQERIDEIAYYRSVKRKIINERLDIDLLGDKEDDHFKAVALYTEYGDEAVVPTYTPQIETVCSVHEAMFKKNACIRLPVVQLVAPPQNGKTGVTFGVAELFLIQNKREKRHAKVVFLSLVGQTGLAYQLNIRRDQYARGSSSCELFSLNTSVNRCNDGAAAMNKFKKMLQDSTRTNPMLLIPDENHIGTEVHSRFDRYVLQNLPTEGGSVLNVSATPFEVTYGCDFNTVRMNVTSGYRGPSMINGQKWPHTPDYIENDVEIKEIIPTELKYYFVKGREQHIIPSKVCELVDFIHDSVGLEQTTIKWNLQKAADLASDYIKDKYKNIVHKHYGEYLKIPLREKWIHGSGSTLCVVDSMTCSQTLPKDIINFVDADSFHLDNKMSTVATVCQGGYGRSCGYNKPNSCLVSAAGSKKYVDWYKNGPISSELKLRPHGRVGSAEDGNSKFSKIQIRRDDANESVWKELSALVKSGLYQFTDKRNQVSWKVKKEVRENMKSVLVKIIPDLKRFELSNIAKSPKKKFIAYHYGEDRGVAQVIHNDGLLDSIIYLTDKVNTCGPTTHEKSVFEADNAKERFGNIHVKSSNELGRDTLRDKFNLELLAM